MTKFSGDPWQPNRTGSDAQPTSLVTPGLGEPRIGEDGWRNEMLGMHSSEMPASVSMPSPMARDAQPASSSTPDTTPVQGSWISDTDTQISSHTSASPRSAPTNPKGTIQKWADPAMFKAQALDAKTGPKVHLLSAPNDPLGGIAACAKMYLGEVVTNLADVTDEERKRYLGEMQKTKLAMPLESVTFHFILDGVTRAFANQLVRQRTAAYAQESLRFAVIEDSFADRVALPPSLAGTRSGQEQFDEAFEAVRAMSMPVSVDPKDEIKRYLERNTSDVEKQRYKWDEALRDTQKAYASLVANGMPAEDARGLIPLNMTTRVHYITNLRALLDHAGNRLCTQAQFEWRLVFAQIANAIREYGSLRSYEAPAGFLIGLGTDQKAVRMQDATWQFEAIAGLLKPVCYQVGKCVMKADFDRKCSIRNRVDANAQTGRTSDTWGEELDAVKGNPIVSGIGPKSVVIDEEGRPVFIGAIQPREWLADPGAAR